MNDEQFSLASAYVDGELTDDERRTADDDPEVMAEVERLRALQAEMRTAPAPAPGPREAAIAAAMAEFEAAAAEATTETATPTEVDVVPFRPRPAYAKYLAVAAALVAVAGLGIVVSQVGGGGGDDDAASVEDAAIAEPSAREEALSTVAATGAADDDVMAEADRTMAGSAGDSGAVAEEEMAEEMAEEMEEEPASEEVLEAAPAAGAGAEDETVFADDGAADLIVVPPSFDPDAPIVTDTGLAIYGSFLIEQRELGRLAPTPETRCDGDFDVLATAIYVVEGDGRLVFVAVNEAEGFVLALDSDTCAVIGRGDLF